MTTHNKIKRAFSNNTVSGIENSILLGVLFRAWTNKLRISDFWKCEKIAASYEDSLDETSVTLYCRRNSFSDTLVAVYSVSIISTTHPYNGNVHEQGHATFSGPTLESSAKVDINVDYKMLEHIRNYGNTSLQIHITSMEPPAEDTNDKLYEDAFSSVDKNQLFSKSSPFSPDCVIILKDNKEVHVNKTLLSLHSGFWKKKFAIYNKDRFTFMDVDYDEFIDLLSVIYPTAHPITVKNVETLSKLAYKFQMTELLKRCDIFLMANSAKFGRSQLLLLAQNCNIERLQTHCIGEYRGVEDIKAIKNEAEYSYLNERTKRMLLDKIIGIDVSALSDAPVQETSDSVANATRAANILVKLASLSSYPPDIVLVTGNNRIPAHKQFLSYYSEFFYNMFHGEFKESRESEITIEEVRYEEMVELLSVIYPSDYTINDTNIATVVKLADRFMMPLILERCKQELKSSNKIRGALKLFLAQRYNFTDLQVEFAGKCNSIEDVKKLKDEPEFELLDDHVRALILESITK